MDTYLDHHIIFIQIMTTSLQENQMIFQNIMENRAFAPL